MWSHIRRRWSLAGQLLLMQLVVLACVLGTVGVLSVQQSTRVFEEQRGSQLRSVAEYLANVPVVRSQVNRPDPGTALAPAVSRAFALSATDRVGLAAPDGTVLASSDSALNGRPAVLGSSRVIEGRGWSGEIASPDGRVLAAHAPVLGPDGTLLAVTIAEADYPTVRERLALAAPDLLLYLGLGALLGTTGSLLLARVVWRRTRGLRSSEIATLADHRQALLVSIGEGVVAVGRDGQITIVNDSARELLALGPDTVGRPVTDLGLRPEVESLLLATQEAHDAVVVVGERVLVFNQRAASSRGEGIGTVTTLRDRTDLVALQRRLSTNVSLTDTLRAQTHEFANKLHTISGLVQLEQYDEVVTLIGDLSRERRELLDHVADRVFDLPLAALVIAKASSAAEAGVELVLTENSRIPALSADESSDLITVVGNLIDNAVDASRGRDNPSVHLTLQAGPEGQAAEVRDNGPGIPVEVQGVIFARGFTTKTEMPGGRGIGLALVQLICLRRGGSATTNRSGDRTVFRVDLPHSSIRSDQPS